MDYILINDFRKCLKAEEATISPKTEDNIIKELLKLPNLLSKGLILSTFYLLTKKEVKNDKKVIEVTETKQAIISRNNSKKEKSVYFAIEY